jgi:hypothetical protein
VKRLLTLLGVVLALTLTACSSLQRTVNPGRDPAALGEVFIATNLNDNHGLGRRLAAAFRARGLRAESGPLTLLPKTAEAVVQYQDRWAWDFGDHMVYLRLTLHDPGELQPFATATHQRNIAQSTNLDEAIPAVVAELLAPTQAH